MKHPKFLLSTLFAAAALSVAPAVPALADGSGTSDSPYSGTCNDLLLDTFSQGSTIYINGITAGYFGTNDQNSFTCVADVNIGSNGMTLSNGYADAIYTFAGAITGTGNWTFDFSGAQKYVFTGSLAGYSGNIDIEAGNSNGREAYIHFGEGGQATTDTNVSGTGSITVVTKNASNGGTNAIVFNYGSYASTESEAITIGNSSLTSEEITFTGSVNYVVNSAISGDSAKSSSTLTISNTGTTTLKGDVSGIDITVSSGSTLAFDGSVSISGAITNSGTVTLNESVIFVLDDMSFDGNFDTGATFTLIEGGTIKIGSTTLTDSGTISLLGLDNLSYDGTITSATFSYENGSLTVTVIGEEAIVDGLNGDGTESHPYFTSGTTAVGFDVSNFTGAGTTVYFATDTYAFGNSSENIYWSASVTAACNIVIGKAGIYLTNGGSGNYYNFTGAISGEGSWTVSNESGGTVAQHYAFAGDLSGWSGDFTITTSNAYDYLVFGGTINGVSNNAVTGITATQAATNTSVSGTGAIAVDHGTVYYAYSAGASGSTGETLTVTNTSIEGHTVTFAGSVNYDVSANLRGWDGSTSSGGDTTTNSTLTISTTGTVTVTGSISNFDNIVVESSSTLALSGSVDLSSAIENSGTVSLNESVIFALDDLSYTGDWTNGATYTLIEGGTINIGGTTLENGGTISLDISNLSSHSIITSAEFKYEDGTLTVTVSSDVADWIILNDGENYDGLNGGSTADTFDGKTIYVNNSGTVNASNWGEAGSLGAWIHWTNDTANDSSSYRNRGGSFSNTTIVGSGFLGLAVRYGGSELTADWTTLDVSDFSGQISLVNTYGKATTVQLSGDQWKNVEYIFGTATAEWAGVTSSTTNSNTIPYYRGISGTPSDSKDTLALQGDTTLAGITGSSKGYTVSGYNINDNESITVSSSGQTLTIDGSGTYAFYGTLATSGTRANLAMTGTGSQTFGGTNYLQNVTVSAGTLALSGTTNITGSVEVTAGTLELGGEITLSSAISNSGTVVIDSDVVFVLDNLGSSGNTYTIISGGTIYGWDSLDYSNFGLTSARQLTSSDNGTITIDTSASAHSLTWNGSSGDTWNSNVSGNTVWTNGTGNDYFVNGDSVTFSDTGTYTITISGNVHAATMTVSGGDYTFSTSGSDTLTVDTLNMSGGNITFGVDATIGTFNTATGSGAQGKTITLSEGTTVTVGTLTNDYGSSFVLGAGSVLETDSATFASYHTDTVSGTGTWKAGTFSFANYGTYTFSGITLDVTDMTVGNSYQYAYVTIDGGTADIGTLSLNSDSSITFSNSGTYTVGTMNISGSSTLGGTVTIGSMSENSGSTFTIAKNSNITITGEFLTSPSGGTNIALEEGAKLTVETLTSDWGTSFTLAEGAVIETTSASFLTGSEDKVSGSGTWIAESFTFGNVGSYIFDGVSLIADTVTLAGSNGSSASLTLTGGATFTIGTYQQTDNQNSIGTSLTIGDNTTVDVGTFTVSWHQETTTLGDGAVLNVTTELSLHTTGTEEFTGGTINAEKISLSNSGTNASFSNGTLNIGSGGITNSSTGSVIFGDNLTVGVYAGANGTNTGWSTSSAIQLAGNVTFNTLADESITLSGNVTIAESGTGTIIKTGAGTLTIAGAATLTDGLTVEQGTFNVTGSVELANTVTLGNSITLTGGTVTIDNGTTFVLDTMSKVTADGYDYYVIIGGSGTVSFSGDISSFTLGGNSVSGWTLYNSGDGNLVIYTTSSESITLTWAGTDDDNTWSTAYADAPWTSEGGETARFSTGDSVIFAASTTVNKTVLIGADTITAGTVTVTGSGYVLVATNPAAEGEYNLIADTLVLDDEDSETSHTFTIAEGTAVQVGELSETAGQLDLVVNGTLDVTGMTVNTEQDESISGSGKLTVGTLTHSSLQGTSLTISVAEATFTNIYLSNHGNDNSSATGYHTLIIGDADADHTTAAVVTGTLSLSGGTSEVAVAAGSTLTVGTLEDTSGYKTSISGEGTLIADKITIAANSGNTVDISIANLQVGTVTINTPTDASSAGYAAVTISSANFTADSLVHNSQGSLTISSANAVIGLVQSDATHTITIADEGKLTTGEIYRSGSTLNLAVDGELYVEKDLEGYSDSTGIIHFGTSSSSTTMSQTISGEGTVNAYGIEAYFGTGNTNHLTISVANLNIGEGGITESTGSRLYIDGTTIGLYKATEVTIAANMVIDSGGVAFDLDDGETLTVSGTITGNGLVALTGSGSLVLSGSGSTLTNGVTVSGGSVEISGTATIGGTVTLASAIVNTGTITVADNTTFVIDGIESKVSTGGSTYYEIISGNSGSLTLGSTYTFSGFDGWKVYADNGYLVIYLENETLVWNGTDDNNSWTTDSGTTNWISDSGTDPAAFTSGANVQFTADASEKTVAIVGDINAGNITVSASGYKFDFSTAATVTTYNLNIENGASLEISGEGTILAIYSATITGSLALGSDATIDLSAIALGELTTTANITGTGTIIITGANGAEVGISVSDDFTGTVRVVSGDLDFAASQTGGATFEFTSGGSLYVRATDAKYENDIVVTGGEGSFYIRTSSATGVELAGSFTSDAGITIQKYGDGSSSITLSGDVDIAGTYRQYQGSTTFTGDSININDINYNADGSNNSNLTINSSGEVTIGEITMAATSARGSLTLEGSATYTIGTIDFTNSGLLVIGKNATVTVDSITDTAAVASHITIDGTLTVGEMTFGTGSAGSLFNQIDGAGTIIVGTLNVGTTQGTSVVVSGVTMVAGSITFGTNSNSTYNLYLHDATLGFADDTTVEGGSNIYLNDSSSSTATTVTINTGVYDVSTGTFSDTEGYTVTISSNIGSVDGTGTDTLVKAGAGTLVLSGANTLSGGITTTGGTLQISGSTTIAGTVDVGASIVNSGTITIEDGTEFVINVAEKTDSSTGKTYYELITGSGSGTITLGSDCQFILKGEALPSIYEVYAEGGYLVLYSNAVDLLWNGTSSDNTWVAENGNEIWISNGGSGDATKFAEYANVVFTSDGYSTVNISGTVHVSTATIESGDYVWQDNGAVYGSTLTLAEGSSLNAESAYLYFNEIELAGTLTFRYGSDSWDKLTFLEYNGEHVYGGELFLRDLSKADNATLTISEVEVDAAGRIYARYGGTLNLDKITGSGTLTFDAYDNDSSGTNNHIFYINIADLSEYTGTLTFVRTGTETDEKNIVTPRGTITAESWVNASVVVDSDATVILQTTGGSTMQAGHISVNSGGLLDVDGTVELSTAITVNTDGTVTFGNDAVFVLNSSLITSTDTYTLITGEGTIDGWDKLTYSNFELEGGEVITSARQLDLSTAGQVIVNLSESAHNLTWAGSETYNVWTSNGETIWINTDITGGDNPYEKFVDGDNVTFTEDGYTTVSVDGTVTAGTVTIASGDYTWQNGTVYGDKLTIAEGASLNASTSSGTTTYLGFKEIELAGWLNLRAGNASLDKLTFSGTTGDGFLFLRDISELGSDRSFTISEVDVTSDGTISSRYYGTLTIESITGSANLTLNADDTSANNGSSNFTFYVDLLDLSNYTGTIFVTETTNNHSNGATWIQVNISTESWANASVNVGDETTVYLETDSGSMTAGSITVQSGGTLVIADDMTLDLTAAIDNSGTVTLGDGVIFVLDDALKADDGTYTYTFITGEGTIVDWDKLDYTNFVFADGSVLVSNRQLISSDNGTIVINPDGTSSPTLVWNGTSDSDVWSTAGAEIWLNSGASDKFWEGDSVLFDDTSSYRTVKIEGSFAAGTVTVNADYTFVFADGIKIEAEYVDIAADTKLTLQLADGASSAEFHMNSETFVNFFTGSDENHGNLEIGSGVTFYLSDSTDSYTFNSSNTGVSITGTGTLSVGTTNSIGLYLPDFEGTVEFRSGTVRFGYQNSYDTGVFNSNATLLFDDGVGIVLVGNTTNAVSAALVFEGSTTIDSNGHDGEFSGAVDASGITLTKTGSGTITFSGSDVDIGTLTVSAGNITFGGEASVGTLSASSSGSAGNTIALEENAKVTVGTMTNAWGSNFTLAEGSVLTVDTATFSSGSTNRTVSGSGTFIVGTLTISNYANYTIDGVTFVADTVTFGGSSTALTFTGGGDFTVGTMTDTATNVSVNIGEDTTLNITGSMGFGTGSASGTVTKVTGAGADTSTLVVGELDIGTNNGVSVQMTDLTLVVGSFVNGSNTSSNGLNFYLYLQDSTLGFTNDVTIATHSGGSTSRIVLGTKSSSSFSATDDFSTVTINTSKYDTNTGSFSATEGVTVTISETIIGGGALVVDGVGTLTLSGANTFEGGVTLAGGTLAIASADALGTGALTVCTGTTLASTSGTVTLTDKSFVINGSSTFSGIILAGTMTFDWAAGAQIALTDSGSVTGTGSVHFADDTDFTYDGVILFTNTGLSAGNLTGWTASYEGTGSELFGDGGTFSVDSNGNIIFVASDDFLAQYGTLVWDASVNDQTWTSGTFQDTTGLGEDRNYLFNGKSTGATSLLTGEISTNRVTIASAAGEIKWAVADGQTTATISGSELIIEAGANLWVGTDESKTVALAFEEIKLGGKLSYESYGDSWGSLEFTDNGAELYIENFQNSLSIDKVIVSADATISSHWGYWGLGGGSEAYSALKIGTLSGTGDLSITGPTGDLQILAVEVGDMSNYAGTITLSDSDQYSNVVLRLAGNSSNTYEFADVTIVVGVGGALDANGQTDIGFNTVLAGGILTSSSSIGNTSIQFPTITLTADSSVDAGSGVSFGMVARGFGESDLYLNGNTLTKTGDGTFFLLDTTVWGADDDVAGSTGKLLVSEGTLELDGVTVNDAAIVVESGGKLYIASETMSGTAYGSTTLDNLSSSGTVEIGGSATLELVSDTTLTGALVIDSNGTLSVTNGAVVDITGITTSAAGTTGILSVSGEGSTLKIANAAWGSSSNFGANMYNGMIQIADGGILEFTEAQTASGDGERGFSVTSGTGTYRYSGKGTSYISSTERNIHLADGATLVFEVTNSDATLDVSMVIANGISTSADVIGSVTTSTGSLQKTGAGTLILEGSNLYSGGTTVSEGELIAKTTTALGSGDIAIEEGGTLTLDVSGTYTTTVEITGTGTLALAEGTTLSLTGTNFSGFGGTTQISSDAQLSLTGDSTTYTLSSTILGTGSLSIDGGTLQIAAEDLSSFKGSTTIATGATLKFVASEGVEASEFAGTILGDGSLVVDEGATLMVNATAIADFEGTTQISSDATLELIIEESFTGELKTEISGTGTLVKSGSGTLTLGNGISVSNVILTDGTLAGLTLSEGMTATVTGGTLDSFSMEGGELIISATTSTSITGSSTTISGGTISLAALDDTSSPYFNVAEDVTITIAGEVTFNLSGMDFSSAGKSEIVIFDQGVTFDSGCSVDNLTLTYDGESYDDDPHFTGEQNFTYDETEGSLSVTVGMEALDLHWQGSSDEGGNILQTNETGNFYDVYEKKAFFIAGDTIYFDGTGDQAVMQSSVLLGSDIEAAEIIVQNGAEITLDTDNGTYSLTGSGTLTVAEGSSLTLTNARHSYTGDTTVDGSLTLNITEASGSGQLFASLVRGSGSLTLDIADGLEISIASNLTGDGNQLIAGSISFVKSGSGTLVVDAAQTAFTGEVQITGGTMVIGSSDLFGTEATIAIDTDGTLEISADIDSMTETLSGAGTLLIDEDITLVTEASNIAGLTGSTLLSDGAVLELITDTDVTTTLTSTITGTGSNATLVKTGEGTLTLADDTSVTEILVVAGTLGNVALSEGMTLTATKGTGLSGITMTAGTLDVSDVFDDPTASITLSGTNSFTGGTINLGNGILVKDGEPVTDPITSAFIITSGSTTTVSSNILFDLEGVDVPDVVFNEDGERCYTVAYYVFTVETDASLEGWDTSILQPSNFAIDGVQIDADTSRTRVELASDDNGNAYVEFYITEYDLTWDGGESGVWNTSDEIWTRSAGTIDEVYKNGDSVTFSDSENKLTITIEGGNVTPGSLTVDADTDVTINGNGNAISNKKGVITIGENGSLTLTSAGNVMGGGVTIGDNGSLTLKVSSDEAYLTTDEVALAAGATSGTFTIDTDAGVDATYETVLTGTLADSEGLTLSKTGSGTLEITEAHDYSDLTVTVSEGTLALTGDGTLGSVDINLAGNATLELNADEGTTKDIENSISGIGSAATIVKTGEGEITVSGDNSGFSGTVEIYEGTLTLTSTTALGSVSKTTIAEDGTLYLNIGDDFDLNDIVGTVSGSGTIEINLGTDGTIYASSGYYGSDKFTDFTGSFVIDGGAGTTITMEVDVSNTSRGSAIGDANVELGEGVNLVFNIQNAGYSYGGSISGSGNVSFKWDSSSSASHTFSLTGDNSKFDGTITIDDIVLTAEGGAALGSEKATVVNNNELWIDEDETSSVVAKLTGSGNLHKTGSGAVKITNADNTLSGDLEIREGSLCFTGTAALGGITTASVSEGATFELEVYGEDALDITITGEGSVVIHGEDGNCIVPYGADAEGYSTDKVTLANNDNSSYNGGFTVDSAYLVTEKSLGFDYMNELGTGAVTITNNSTWDASNGGFTASGSRTINIQDHSRLLAGAFSAVANPGGSISISNIRVDTDSDDAASLYISVTSSNDISRKYITGHDGTIYLDGVDIYLDTTITSFGQITVIDTSSGLKIDGTPNVYINGELEAESYWINGVISQDSVSEDVKKNGLSYAAMVVMPTEAFNQDVRTIHTRLEQRRFAFSREGEWEFFAQAQTIQEDSGSSSDSKSFDYYTYGAIVGADVRIDQTTIFGMALAYDHGDAKIHDSGGHIKMDDYRFTAFASKVFAEWLFVEGGVQAGVGSYDIRRRAGSTVGDNNGDTDGVNVGGFFNFGGVVPITNNIFLTPYIGFTYMYSHVDSFDEEGSYGYKADDFDANSLRGKIGTQLRAELMLGDVPTALALGLSYAHEFIDDDIDYDVAAITYSDKKQSLTENAFTEDLISIGLSAEFGVTDAASVFMGYNADIGLGNSEVSHAVNAGVKVTF